MLNRRLLKSESGQIVRRVILFVVVFAVIILLVVEIGPLIWGRFTVSNDAEEVGTGAAQNYRLSHDIPGTVAQAAEKLKFMGYTDEEITQCQVIFNPQNSPTKTSVTVTVVKYANTLIIKHINALKKLTKITSTKTYNI